ncbi:MAG: S-methyl-5'-thioadenosine phosphorylase [Bacteroidetes bacterium]|nr:S-methyl-5'-thioadenosine phosphorylase [Bacteroidota bacterium]
MIKLGIIGGSGLEKLNLFTDAKVVEATTKYGTPSSPIICGKISGIEVFIISRHGTMHDIPPTQVNNRANITALKEIGCTHILATTACGSLKEEIKPGDMVVPDQFIDFTRHRTVTFFESFEAENMAHTPMADPFDSKLREIISTVAGELNFKIHDKGTIITIEGPRFSTRAESKMFRMWGADLINMSTAPEAILANEAQIPYAAIALSTDYDCWKTDIEAVSWESVLKVFNQNVNNVTLLLVEIIKKLGN